MSDFIREIKEEDYRKATKGTQSLLLVGMFAPLVVFKLPIDFGVAFVIALVLEWVVVFAPYHNVSWFLSNLGKHLGWQFEDKAAAKSDFLQEVATYIGAIVILGIYMYALFM